MVARRLSRLLLVALIIVLVALPVLAWPGASAPLPGRVVVVAGDLSDDELIRAGSLVRARGRTESVLLLDSPTTEQPRAAFLKGYRPEEVIPMTPQQPMEDRISKAPRVVVAPTTPRRMYMQAAHLAGVLRAPLLKAPAKASALLPRLKKWQTEEVLLVGDAGALRKSLKGFRITALPEEDTITALAWRTLAEQGQITTLVVANPTDTEQGCGRLSLLAPYFAAERRAGLVLTNERGTDVAQRIEVALASRELRGVETLLLAASLQAIPTEQRPNPVPGKDTVIDMEPLTPRGSEPFSFAVGRLFHEDLGMAALLFARSRLLDPGKDRPRKALVVSNPGSSLPLLETFSRHTALELRNAGYETTGLFGPMVSPLLMRRMLPENDLFLWEGHYKTLVEHYRFLTWDEPLPPALFFLQSCLALKEQDAQPLYQRGALAIVGASTRIYSATGGAFSLAYFNALLYEDESLGGALRQAKNFLLVYTLLKEKRLGKEAKLTGANLRSAWAFSLWGDPTVKLPHPLRPKESLSGVRHEVRGKALTLILPPTAYDPVAVKPYEASMLPNARLAGLIRRADNLDDPHDLVPFVFAEVRFADGPPGKRPQLSSTLSEKSWIFNWDARRGVGYLLITPRLKGQREVNFKIRWV